MEDLMTVVDWSRWQFALTAIYHWLFVPLTLGLSIIVAIMESVYLKTKDEKWMITTKFWMTIFGINFAIGVATGIILEFEFGTNWSNYSWFVGDIFGAPLAIEGLAAFFLEATFGAVMFFGWGKVSKGFHLTATWLTAIGASLSALWILIANAWMQFPQGMEFGPDQMRNVMVDFWGLFTGVAVNKFLHAVFSGWCLAGVFVVSVSAWFLWKKRNLSFAIDSIKVAGWVGLIGLLLTIWRGDSAAVDIARVQPMKLAAMEGLYNGSVGQPLVAFGIVNPKKEWNNNEPDYSFCIDIPQGLSLLANRRLNTFVPGVSDLVRGFGINMEGDTINTVSYQDRILIGKLAQAALKSYGEARQIGDVEAMESSLEILKANYPFFGYGFLDDVQEAIPPVGVTFSAFHTMVYLGGYFLLFFIVALIAAYKGWFIHQKWMQWTAIISLPFVYLCSEAGWVVSEVGRQPWTVQDLLPTKAAISGIASQSVIVTFWLFALIFTVLLIAEVSIMCRQISKGPNEILISSLNS